MTFEEIKRRYVANEMTPSELKSLRWDKVISVPQYADIRIAAAGTRRRAFLKERQKKQRSQEEQQTKKKEQLEKQAARRRQQIEELKDLYFGYRAVRRGLKRAQLEAMLNRQNFDCAICLGPFTAERRPQIDHCHKSKKIRGLLCRDCNLGLGYFKDSPRSLDNAACYLTGDYYPQSGSTNLAKGADPLPVARPELS